MKWKKDRKNNWGLGSNLIGTKNVCINTNSWGRAYSRKTLIRWEGGGLISMITLGWALIQVGCLFEPVAFFKCSQYFFYNFQDARLEIQVPVLYFKRSLF